MSKKAPTNVSRHDFRPKATSGLFRDERGDMQTSLSSLECEVMLMLEYEAPVVGMETQRLLLPNEELLEISEAIRVAPPCLGPKQHLSTDILVQIQSKGREETLAVNVKPEEKAWVPDTVRKRKIEAEYWRRRRVTHRLITDERCHLDYRRNLRHAHACHSGARFQEDLLGREDVFSALGDLLNRNLRRPLGLLTDTLDERFALEVGDSMTLLWAAIWQGCLAADLEQPLTAFSPAVRLRVLPWRTSTPSF